MKNQKDLTSNSNLVVALDIGTTKVCVVAALVNGDELEIIGSGVSKSHGLRKGVIVNREHTVQSIKSAVDECQRQCGHKIESVCVGIAGEHIEGINSHGVVSVKNEIIDESDIVRVIDSARPACPEEKVSIHILPQNYTVDYQPGFENPCGITGKRLEANVHVVLANRTVLTNITRSCADAGLITERIVLEPYASALSVLNEDEKELGVLLLDIGGGTTDMLVYKNQSIQMSGVIPIGGTNVTRDIAVGFISPINYAEQIKCSEGFAYSPGVDQQEVVEVTSIADRPKQQVTRKALAEAIEPRYTEIFETVIKALKEPNEALYPSGVVLTGGGSGMKGLEILAEKIFNSHVRIGYPNSRVKGANDFVKYPAFATAVGILKYVVQDDKSDFVDFQKESEPAPKQKSKKVLNFIKQFF